MVKKNVTPLTSDSTPALLAKLGITGPVDPDILREVGRRYLAQPFRKGERLDSPILAAERLRALLTDEKREHFIALTVDARLRLLGEHTIALGGLSEVHVRPREAFMPALKDCAAAVIFAHNHPTGDPEPSAEDIILTRRLCLAGEILGIRVLDHLVVAGNGYVSLSERGHVPQATDC